MRPSDPSDALAGIGGWGKKIASKVLTLGYFAHFRTFKIFPVARNEISSLTDRKSLGISILNDIDIH